MVHQPRFLRCDCGALLTDRIIKLGVCAGHRQRYATQGTLLEWLLIKLGIWETLALWRAKKEVRRLKY